MPRFMLCIPAAPIPYSFGFGLVYRIPADDRTLTKGSCVMLPYGKKLVPGVCWGETLEPSGYTVRDISSSLGWSLNADALNWIERLSESSLQSLSSFVQYLLPSFLFSKGILHPKVSFPESMPVLRPSQIGGSEEISPRDQLHWIDSYGQAAEVEQILKRSIQSSSGQHLILLPTEEDAERWSHLGLTYFGTLTPAKKRSIWSSIAMKTPHTIIGTPVSLFLPWTSLRSIHLLREHDDSYSQSFHAPFYDARDAAALLSHVWKIPISLYSATPRMTTYASIH